MTTVSLYQKYRPTKFDEIIGQDHIIKPILNQLENDSPSHSYLFYGTRGLGKTTTARLMAKALDIADEDLYEIDAASNRGIDDIREIKEGVKSNPFSSPYKMYLIDEVHMLTKEAFNALLKTLEEPPKYVIFILATTELHKVPSTIQSRSQIYTFKQPDSADLEQLIDRVASSEDIQLDEGAKKSLIYSANGSYRDVLGLLQRYSADPGSFSQSTSLDNSATEILGLIDDSQQISELAALIDALESANEVKILYLLLLEKANNRLYEKIVNQSDDAINSKVIESILSVRYYCLSQEFGVARSGILILLDKLSNH